MKEESERIINEVHLDFKNRLCRIYNEFYLYGDNASQEHIKRITKDAMDEWNDVKGYFYFNNEKFNIQFYFVGFLLQNFTETALKNNKYPWKKYFKLEVENSRNISYIDGLYGNTGVFLQKNIMDIGSTTAAHEIGHTWGLKHPENMDYRGHGCPHIMFPRGTFVDPEFRYNPLAELKIVDGKYSMDKGFTLDTKKRKVTQENISDLGLETLDYNEEYYANMSILRNIFHA